jgi:hypothetical protein
MADPIKIKGLREFQGNLRKMDRDLPKLLRLALNDAADVVVDAALPRIPRRTGRAAASLKAKSTQRVSRVAGGSTRAPYYAWLDFGGRVGRRQHTVRYFLKRGRYLYPAYDRSHDEVATVLKRRLIELATGAGLQVD